MRYLLAFLLVACGGTELEARKVTLIDAPPAGAIEPIVTGELGQAAVAGDRLIVYIGATWCEPCRAFHEAAEQHLLDEKLPGLRLLVFDADRDGGALESAGYHYELIPLFAVPRADGHASGKQIEGAIKGQDAVGFIVPRLQALLAR